VKIIRATHEGLEIASPYLANLHPWCWPACRGRGGRPDHHATGPCDAELEPAGAGNRRSLSARQVQQRDGGPTLSFQRYDQSSPQHIFRKIGVSSRLEAVVFFLTGWRAN